MMMIIESKASLTFDQIDFKQLNIFIACWKVKHHVGSTYHSYKEAAGVIDEIVLTFQKIVQTLFNWGRETERWGVEGGERE